MHRTALMEKVVKSILPGDKLDSDIGWPVRAMATCRFRKRILILKLYRVRSIREFTFEAILS